MGVLILSGNNSEEADELFDTLENENLFAKDEFEWDTIKDEDDLDNLNFTDDVNKEITRRFLDNKIVYIGICKKGKDDE